MIILNENMGVEIPNYDDLDNKPKINGVTLEGDLTSEELGIDLDTTRYYTKTESDNRFQPKGDYLTSVPSEYVTETELNDAINKLDIGIQSISVDDGRAYLTATTTNNNVELDLTIGSLTHHVSGVLDAQMTDEYLSETFYTKTEIDLQIGDINTILENIIG